MYSLKRKFKVILLLFFIALLHSYTPSVLNNSVISKNEEQQYVQKVDAQNVVNNAVGNEIAISQVSESISSANVPDVTVSYTQTAVTTADASLSVDDKIARVKDFLSKRNAPLAAYSDVLVEDAIKYGVDYRLAAAISITESSGGMYDFLPYNAWGFMGHSFSSYNEAIDIYTQYLKTDYINLGLTTPQLISVKYCPPNSAHWAYTVSSNMNHM